MDTPPASSPQKSPFDQKGIVANAMDVPFFREGSEGPQILSVKDMNLLVSILRSLVNPKMVEGPDWDVRLSDSGFTFQRGSPTSPPGASGGTSLMFRLKSVQG